VADSGVLPRRIHSGDTATCAGSWSVQTNDTMWTLSGRQVAEGATYQFFVRIGGDSASFSLPVPAFNVTAPLPQSQVTSYFNDTVRYTSAGGSKMWLGYSAGNVQGTDQTPKPDNGAYVISPMPFEGDGSIHLIRNFSGTLSNTRFLSLNYDYWTM